MVWADTNACAHKPVVDWMIIVASQQDLLVAEVSMIEVSLMVLFCCAVTEVAGQSYIRN